MSFKPSFQSSKEAMRRKRQTTTLVFSVLAILLVALGVWMIWMWGSGSSLIADFMATDTPIATGTNEPTGTPLPPSETMIPTASSVPTDGPTSTALAPFQITVESGDSLVSLAEKYGLDPDLGWLIIMQYNAMDNTALFLNQTLIIPHPDAELFTPTPIPASAKIVEYLILPGDTGKSIADQFLSTLAGIEDENEGYYEDRYGFTFEINFLRIGDIIRVPVRLVTPTYAPPNTNTPTPAVDGTATPFVVPNTSTPTPGG